MAKNYLNCGDFIQFFVLLVYFFSFLYNFVPFGVIFVFFVLLATLRIQLSIQTQFSSMNSCFCQFIVQNQNKTTGKYIKFQSRIFPLKIGANMLKQLMGSPAQSSTLLFFLGQKNGELNLWYTPPDGVYFEIIR